VIGTAKAFRLVVLCLGTAGAAGCASHEAGPTPRPKVNLADRGYYKVGQPYVVDGVVYTPAEDWTYDETGIASWYGPDFHGKLTANGELYDMNQVTGAHKTLPMPSLVRVTNLDNGRSIIVRVNDRGPFSRGRILDMSRRGAQLLGFERVGTAKVRVQILTDESKALAEAARQGKLMTNLAGLDANAAPPPAPPGLRVPAAPRPTNAQPTYTQPTNAQPAYTQPTAPLYPADQQQALAAVAVVDETSVLQQEVPHPAVKGADVDGRFLPAPRVAVRKVGPSSIYIQAGSFSVAENAERLKATLSRVSQTEISPTMVNGRALYRVRVGPIASVDQADLLLARVVGVGATDAKIIVD